MAGPTVKYPWNLPRIRNFARPGVRVTHKNYSIGENSLKVQQATKQGPFN